MTVAELLQFAVAAISGGALTKAIDATVRWQRGSAQSKRIETSTYRDAVDHAIKVVSDEIKVLKAEVDEARAENRELREEHSDCLDKYTQLELEMQRKDSQIAILSARIASQGEQLKETLAILKEQRSPAHDASAGDDAATTLP